MSVSHFVDENGIWIERQRPVMATGRVLFCDRDGVIIHDRGYLSDPEGVELIDGIAEIFSAAERARILLR